MAKSLSLRLQDLKALDGPLHAPKRLTKTQKKIIRFLDGLEFTEYCRSMREISYRIGLPVGTVEKACQHPEIQKRRFVISQTQSLWASEQTVDALFLGEHGVSRKLRDQGAPLPPARGLSNLRENHGKRMSKQSALQ